MHEKQHAEGREGVQRLPGWENEGVTLYSKFIVSATWTCNLTGVHHARSIALSAALAA